MSYTPADQVITETLEKTLKVLRRLDGIALTRLESGDWNKSHDEKLKRLRAKIVDMQSELISIKTGT